MPGGPTVPTIIAVLAIFGIAGVAAAAIAGKLPFLAHAFERVASQVSETVGATSPAAPSPESPGSRASSSPAASSDGGAADAGFKPRRQTAPLSSAQLGAPLVHGTFVAACGAPDTMKVVLKLDVRQGRAFNVRVKTDPPDAAVSACIARAVRDLQWDSSPKTGHVTVTY